MCGNNESDVDESPLKPSFERVCMCVWACVHTASHAYVICVGVDVVWQNKMKLSQFACGIIALLQVQHRTCRMYMAGKLSSTFNDHHSKVAHATDISMGSQRHIHNCLHRYLYITLNNCRYEFMYITTYRRVSVCKTFIICDWLPDIHVPIYD